MRTEVKNAFDVIFASVQLLVLLGGAIWAFYRFRREAPLEYRVEFDVDCEVVGSQQGVSVVLFTVWIHNKGSIEHRFSRLALRVRGIEGETPLSVRDDARLLFPVELLTANLVPEKEGYYFVRPGIKQAVRMTAMIPKGISFILARASFKYVGSDDLHTAETVLHIEQT